MYSTELKVKLAQLSILVGEIAALAAQEGIDLSKELRSAKKAFKLRLLKGGKDCEEFDDKG